MFREFSEHDTWINSISYSPDGKLLASGTGDRFKYKFLKKKILKYIATIFICKKFNFIFY